MLENIASFQRYTVAAHEDVSRMQQCPVQRKKPPADWLHINHNNQALLKRSVQPPTPDVFSFATSCTDLTTVQSKHKELIPFRQLQRHWKQEYIGSTEVSQQSIQMVQTMDSHYAPFKHTVTRTDGGFSQDLRY